MLEVQVPTRLNRHTMYDLLRQVVTENGAPVADRVALNLHNLNFIDPTGVTVLASLIQWFRLHGVTGVVNCPTSLENDSAVKYLDDALFFERILHRKLLETSVPRQSMLPPELVSYEESYSWIGNRFVPWLAQRISVTQQSLGAIEVCFGEIFNNIRDHAEVSTGSVFVQHYPKRNTVCVAISDFGVGIPNTMRDRYPELDDTTAIYKATLEGVTRRSVPGNRGAGLSTLVNNVVVANKGYLYIHSGNGAVWCSYEEETDTLQKTGNYPDGYYPGTLLDIVFRTDTIPNIDDEEDEFQWI